MTRLLAFVAFAIPLLLRAQYEVSVSLPAKSFLLYEGIPLRIQIQNRSSEPVTLGGRNPDGLVRISVRDVRNRVIPRTSEPLLPEGWVIPPGATEAREFDLVQLFELRHSDSYRVTVVVDLDEEAFSGPAHLFDITNGTTFETLRRRKNDRVFTLLGINRNGRDELLLRVSSLDGNTHFATYFLERHLRYFPPQMLADDSGRIGVFHYQSPTQGVLCRFEADGRPIGREYYRIFAGSPATLVRTADRGLAVSGAERIENRD